MPHPLRLFAAIAALAVSRLLAAGPAADPLPRGWIDPETGHPVIRLSPAERLVDIRRHDDGKATGVEPNGTFTPDGKSLIFSGHFHSPRVNERAVTHTYAVEIAKRGNKTSSE